MLETLKFFRTFAQKLKNLSEENWFLKFLALSYNMRSGFFAANTFTEKRSLRKHMNN